MVHKERTEETYEDILEHTSLGLWRICADFETECYELYADPVMLRVMGWETALSPKECYFHWYNRINDGYYNYINLAIQSAVETGKITQVEYTWNHPSRGEVTVRCMMIRAKRRTARSGWRGITGSSAIWNGLIFCLAVLRARSLNTTSIRKPFISIRSVR